MLREISMADFKELYAIERACYHPFGWSEKNFANALLQSTPQYGVEMNHQLVGFSLVRRILPEAELLNIAIRPDMQRQGLGQLLLAGVTEELRRTHYERLFLEVRISNKKAIALYERLGFNQIGERMDYYPSKTGREDALIYALELSL